jgi:hypothetical protein
MFTQCFKNEYVYPMPQLCNSKPIFCERSNYIPHATPKGANRCEWHYAYMSQIIDIYNIIKEVINERYPRNKIKWNSNQKIFHNLSRVLYHCSSKI